MDWTGVLCIHIICISLLTFEKHRDIFRPIWLATNNISIYSIVISRGWNVLIFRWRYCQYSASMICNYISIYVKVSINTAGVTNLSIHLYLVNKWIATSMIKTLLHHLHICMTKQFFTSASQTILFCYF